MNLDNPNRCTVEMLRNEGYAVIVWSPAELKGADPERVEDRSIELGWEVINDLSVNDLSDDDLSDDDLAALHRLDAALAQAKPAEHPIASNKGTVMNDNKYQQCIYNRFSGELIYAHTLPDDEDPEDGIRLAVVAAMAAGISLAGADLHGADLASMDITGNFSGADLSYADLSHSRLLHPDFGHADMTCANLNDVRGMWSVRTTKATRMVGARITSGVMGSDAMLVGMQPVLFMSNAQLGHIEAYVTNYGPYIRTDNWSGWLQDFRVYIDKEYGPKGCDKERTGIDGLLEAVTVHVLTWTPSIIRLK